MLSRFCERKDQSPGCAGSSFLPQEPGPGHCCHSVYVLAYCVLLHGVAVSYAAMPGSWRASITSNCQCLANVCPEKQQGMCGVLKSSLPYSRSVEFLAFGFVLAHVCLLKTFDSKLADLSPSVSRSLSLTYPKIIWASVRFSNTLELVCLHSPAVRVLCGRELVLHFQRVPFSVLSLKPT